jgi:hypothetical protein
MSIGVNIHDKKPQITIGQWKWNSQLSRPIQKANLTITKSDGETRFYINQPTPRLLIPFHLLFRRPAEVSKERGEMFPTKELVEFDT